MKTTKLSRGALALIAAVATLTTVGAGLPAAAAEPTTQALGGSAPLTLTRATQSTSTHAVANLDYLMFKYKHDAGSAPSNKMVYQPFQASTTGTSGAASYYDVGQADSFVKGATLAQEWVSKVDFSGYNTNGQAFPIYQGGSTTTCLNHTDSLGGSIRFGACGAGSFWRITAQGWLVSSTNADFSASVFSNGRDDTYLAMANDNAHRHPLANFHTAASFSGVVQDITVSKQAWKGDDLTLTGKSEPNTIVRYNGQQATVNSSGDWTMTIAAVPAASTSITLVQVIAGDEARSATVTLQPRQAPLTATAAAGASNTTRVLISGTGEPGASITITDPAGKSLATTTVDASTGEYSARVAAPNKAGTQTFTVEQTAAGAPAGSVSVDFDYGAGVSVTSPANGSVHPGGELRFSGRGEAGGSVTIREEGKSGTVGTGTVLANGNWAITGVNLDGKEHKLVVSQVAKGNNTTTAKLTLSPGAVDTLTAEADASSNNANDITIFGEGRAGGEITIKNSAGAVVATTTVKSGGVYITTVPAPNAAGTHTFTVSQRVAGSAAGSVSVDFDYGAAVTVTSPANGSVHPGGQLSFTGRGEAGGSVTISEEGKTGTVASGTVRANGTWTITGVNLDELEHKLVVSQLSTGNNTTTAKLTLSPGVTNNLTGEAAATTNNSDDVTIVGQGRAGAAITITNAAGTTVATTTVSSNGVYFATVAAPNAAGTHTFTVSQRVAGSAAGSVNVDFDYGSAVTITSPANGSVHPGGQLAFTGRGEAGGSIAIREEGKTGTVATGTVQANGTWTITGVNLDELEHKLVVSQLSKGNNTTTATLTLSPGATNILTAEAAATSNNANDVTLFGESRAGAAISVKNAAGSVVGTTTANSNGVYFVTVPAPNAAGVHTFTVSQKVGGSDAGSVNVDFDYGSGVTVTSPANDSVHPGGQVSFTGRGEARGAITIREEGKSGTVATGTVQANGNWAITGVNLDALEHKLVITQLSKGNNTTTAKVTLSPGASHVIIAPVVSAPAAGSTVSISRPTFSGLGEPGATVTIGYGKNLIGMSRVNTAGEWTINPSAGLALGKSDLTITQTAGTDVKTIQHTLFRVAAVAPFAVTSHANNDGYAEGVTTFRGTGAEGATIVAKNQWGTPMGTATVTNGQWSFSRNLGPTTAGYDITFTQTLNGQSTEVKIHLVFAGVLNLQVTSPVNNSVYKVGNTTFTGRSLPGATIRATNQWGTLMGTTITGLDGSWSFVRNLGPTENGYDITFVATKGADTQRTQIHLVPELVNVPVAVTSIKDGDTYRPGQNVLAGTGTPGATVSAVNATNGWNVPMGSATVDSDGAWALPSRNWGPANDYQIRVTQTNPDKTVSSATVNVKAPVFQALKVTSPAVGDTYQNGVAVRFSGTATPFATVTVRSGSSAAVYATVVADSKGEWSFNRAWGPDHTYNLVFDQKALDGQVDTITGFVWAANSSK